ncbi:50S ribosomal protein L4 [Caniella muris]|uniref:50S ribosomal protein L4 n=1 Tax=Caniella muris TaxID=2941502 RepID=UPI00203FE254|nr:50S ribosomal protein L4 [Caniella muris]
MSNIEVKNAEGASVKTVELDSRVFGIEPNIPVVHHVVVNYLSCLRQGTHDTKGRSEVSGGGKKPWRQKGTGRARQGSIRATQWVGGGVPFGPTPRSHYKRTNKKEIKLAMRSVLSGKLVDGELFLVDSIDFGDEPKTKKAKALLESLGIADKRVTVVVGNDDIVEMISFRNLPNVRVLGVNEANTHNLIDNGALLMTEAVAKTLEEALV